MKDPKCIRCKCKNCATKCDVCSVCYPYGYRRTRDWYKICEDYHKISNRDMREFHGAKINGGTSYDE